MQIVYEVKFNFTGETEDFGLFSTFEKAISFIRWHLKDQNIVVHRYTNSRYYLSNKDWIITEKEII